MTTKDDWLFRAHTLREAANRLRFNAAQLVDEAKRYDVLAENASVMALRQCPQEGARPVDG